MVQSVLLPAGASPADSIISCHPRFICSLIQSHLGLGPSGLRVTLGEKVESRLEALEVDLPCSLHDV